MSIEGSGNEARTRERRRSGLNKSAVRAFLLENPEFVLDDSELSHAVIDLGSARYGKNVVNLQSAVMARMRQRLRAVEIEREEMLDAAEMNLLSMNQVHDAVLTMLEAPSFADFLDIVGGRFAELLCVDSVRLCVETVPRNTDKPPSGVEILRPIAPGSVARFFDNAPWGVSLRAISVETAALHSAGDIESEALIRLDFGPDSRPGVLLFGSRDIDRFHEEQGGELLHFLGGAISRAMRRWLDDPGSK